MAQRVQIREAVVARLGEQRDGVAREARAPGRPVARSRAAPACLAPGGELLGDRRRQVVRGGLGGPSRRDAATQRTAARRHQGRGARPKATSNACGTVSSGFWVHWSTTRRTLPSILLTS